MSARDDLDEERARRIEHLLMYLGLHERGFGCPEPMFFDNALPAYETLIKKISANAGHNNREIDARAATLPRIEGVAMFTNEIRNGEGFTLIGCRPLPIGPQRRRILAVASGLIKPPLGYKTSTDASQIVTSLTPVLQVRKVIIGADGHAISSSPAYLAKTKLGKFHDQWLPIVDGEKIENGQTLANMGYNLAVGMSATVATTWSVSLKFDPAAPGLCFITDPTGIREFFKFRKVAEGRDRRSAMVGWVQEHWRASRTSPEDEIFVREHLRGVRKFEWRSLAGEIHVPDLDLKKEEEAKEKRKRMPAHELIRRRKMQR